MTPLAMLRLFLALVLLTPAAFGQGRTYDQRLVGDMLDRQGLGWIPAEPIPFERYVLDHPTGNTVLARHALYEIAGDGDARRGRERLALTLLLNGVALTDLALGDTLVLPARPEDFDLDPITFAPFPREYPGAAAIAKVVIVDKDVQAWAAYEHGWLSRWGPASTGAEGTPTPTGRFTMNWRQLERHSTEAPPGEEWLMRYVMNIHAARGIHIHQYDSVPAGPPVGHGCVRLITADAEWLWDWSEPWTTTAGAGALGGRLIEEGTLVLVQGEEPEGAPLRFVEGPRGPERVTVALPPDPMAVPRGDR